jgi:hypothetical protein
LAVLIVHSHETPLLVLVVALALPRERA